MGRICSSLTSSIEDLTPPCSISERSLRTETWLGMCLYWHRRISLSSAYIFSTRWPNRAWSGKTLIPVCWDSVCRGRCDKRVTIVQVRGTVVESLQLFANPLSCITCLIWFGSKRQSDTRRWCSRLARLAAECVAITPICITHRLKTLKLLQYQEKRDWKLSKKKLCRWKLASRFAGLTVTRQC